MRHIQAYSDLCNLCIYSGAIFRTLAYLEPEASSKACETLTRHIQNPAIALNYSAILTYSERCVTLAYTETWHIRNPDASSEPCHIYENWSTLCNPGNSEPWHIKNPGKLRTLTYLKPDTYSHEKIVKSYSYFSEAQYLRSLTGF